MLLGARLSLFGGAQNPPPSPSGITYLDYIEFQGDGAFIDTGFKNSSSPVIEIDFSRIDSATFYIAQNLGWLVVDEGIPQATYGTYIQCLAWSDTTARFGIQRIMGGTNTLRTADGFISLPVGVRVVIGFDGQYFYQKKDGVELARISGTIGTKTPANTFTINRYMGSLNDTQPRYYKFRIYGATLGDTTGLARKFKPALNEDGEAGLWDEISQTFYGNSASAGTILAGNVINA